MTTRVMMVCARYGPPWNEGVKNMVRLLEEHLSTLGFTITVVSKTGTDPLRSTKRCLPAVAIETIAFWWRVARMARAQGVQVIHLFSSLTSVLGLKSFVIRTLSGVPLVVHITGLGKPTSGYRLLFKADRVIAGGNHLAGFFPGAVVLPPVSPHMNRDDDRSPPADVETIPRRILFLGAMESVRGVHTLIEALALLTRHDGLNNCTLTVAGNGYEEDGYVDRLRAEIAGYGLGDRVRWEQSVGDVPALYQTHDLVVIPQASPERMAFPLRLLEAMSYGKPVVVSDLGEMPQVADGWGVVYPAGDAGALAAALHRLMTDQAFYRQCVLHARQQVKQYHPSYTVTRLVELYEELQDGR